jgi:hypothetical protein
VVPALTLAFRKKIQDIELTNILFVQRSVGGGVSSSYVLFFMKKSNLAQRAKSVERVSFSNVATGDASIVKIVQLQQNAGWFTLVA